MSQKTAHELTVKVNRFDDILAMLEALALNFHPKGHGLVGNAKELIADIKKELKTKPEFEPYHWAQNNRPTAV